MTPDDEQRQVIEADAEDRLLVVAGPGAGKTAVITERVRHLLSEGHERPGDVYVISFSRAAVSVVDARLAGVPDSEVVEVRTLDSIAAEILADEGVEGWERLSFDARIDRALELLVEGAEPDVVHADHIIVDEVQDLVGRRADLVLQILRSLEESSGFTLLGDPLQGIYDFQLGPRSGTGWTTFAGAVTGPLRARRISLTGDYRSQTDSVRAAVRTRDAVEAASTVTAKAQVLSRALNTFADVGPMESFARMLPRWSGRTAVLTWTNGQALAVWDRLWEVGVPAHLQPRAEEVVLAPWIAAVLGAAESRTMTAEEFARHARDVSGVPSDAWELLSKAAPSHGDRLDLGRLVRALRGWDLPPGLEVAPEGVVVSTIHRAKGLEFDNVVVVEPLAALSPARDLSDQTVREAYVAMTRGRSRVALAEWTRDVRVRKDARSDRWYRPGRERWMTFGFELRGSDTRGALDPELAGPEVQAYIRDHVRRGDVLTLELDPRESFEHPTYLVRHGGRTVARTTPAFGEAFARRVRARRSGRSWPDLDAARVETLETRAGVDPAGGGARFWLNVRAAGMAGLEWR